MNSVDGLPFIIFLTPISCDGSNGLLGQRLLPSLCSLWRHKQTLVGVIRPLAGGKSRRFRRFTERYRFHRYLCFHCIFFFCILLCTTRVTISYYNCIHSNSTLNCIYLCCRWLSEEFIWIIQYKTIFIILWKVDRGVLNTARIDYTCQQQDQVLRLVQFPIIWYSLKRKADIVSPYHRYDKVKLNRFWLYILCIESTTVDGCLFKVLVSKNVLYG